MPALFREMLVSGSTCVRMDCMMQSGWDGITMHAWDLPHVEGLAIGLAQLVDQLCSASVILRNIAGVVLILCMSSANCDWRWLVMSGSRWAISATTLTTSVLHETRVE